MAASGSSSSKTNMPRCRPPCDLRQRVNLCSVPQTLGPEPETKEPPHAAAALVLSHFQKRSGDLLAASFGRCSGRGWLGRPLASGTQAHLLGKLGSGCGVVGGDHGIVMGQTPLGPILIRGQVVGRPQMPLQALEPLPVV